MTTVADELPRHADPLPLRVDAGGAVRVGQTRVTLDTVVEQYENGKSPEDLVRAYDTLALADVHAVIAYYLRHREDVRAYLAGRAAAAAALRATIEAARPRLTPADLIARRREAADGPAGQ